MNTSKELKLDVIIWFSAVVERLRKGYYTDRKHSFGSWMREYLEDSIKFLKGENTTSIKNVHLYVIFCVFDALAEFGIFKKESQKEIPEECSDYYFVQQDRSKLPDYCRYKRPHVRQEVIERFFSTFERIYNEEEIEPKNVTESFIVPIDAEEGRDEVVQKLFPKLSKEKDFIIVEISFRGQEYIGMFVSEKFLKYFEGENEIRIFGYVVNPNWGFSDGSIPGYRRGSFVPKHYHPEIEEIKNEIEKVKKIKENNMCVTIVNYL